MHEVNGHELDRAETSVDASNKLVDRRTQVLVLFDVLPRRNCELREDNLADPFGVLAEEQLKSVQFLWDTLDVVETIDTDDHLDVTEALLQLLDTLLDVGFLQVLYDG